MVIALSDVRFRGVKRTLCGRAAMSAFDPKRTSVEWRTAQIARAGINYKF
jgi:hypothetical protein